MPAAEARAPVSGWYRQPWLYLVLGVVVAILGVLWASQRAEQGIRSNLDARLLAAGAGTNASLIALEAEQLAALRAVTFTDGVSKALATRNASGLNRLVTPVQANSGIPMMDMLLPNGRVEFAVRSKGAPPPVANRSNLPGLEQSLREAHGSRGGRFSEVVIFSSGPTVVTMGPVMSGSKAIGVVLAMTPLADALGRFSQQVGATLTAYDSAGKPIATTASFTPRAISAVTAVALIGGAATTSRTIDGDYRETLGRLILDHQAVSVLGVSLPDNASTTGRTVALFAGLGLIGTLSVVMAFFVRRREVHR